MLIYVDDNVVASSSEKAVDALLHDLGLDFALKDLGELHYFLGIVVKKVHDGIILSQEKYANDLLHRVNMQIFKAVDTPLFVADKLSLTNGEEYITYSRPDIDFFSQQDLSVFACPYDSSLDSRYLRGTISLGLHMSRTSSPIINAFLNADWAGCPDDRRSTD
jgi:hypothetical protein